jgi:uncharacterized repeat protein (TIGR03803 family)
MNSIYRQVKHSGVAAIALTMLAAVVLLAGIAIPAQAQTETVLYSFQGSPSGSGPDGSAPAAGPILVGTTLYGTTLWGGAYGVGSVWAVSTTTGKETILYSFQGGASDGEYPYGGLAYYKGSFYGTTANGPTPGYQGGIIFKLTKKGKKYVETILHEFTGPEGSGPMYVIPVFDKEGNLYGTTSGGGADSAGVVFKMSPSGEITVLHSFDYNCPPCDGFTPLGGVSIDAKGNLYGQTNGGGTYDWGTVYEITAAGGYNILYNFDVTDGYNALAPPVLKKNILWGTTEGSGGAYGTVYKLNPKTGQRTLIHQFTGYPDGASPGAGPFVFDKEGNLYDTSGAGAAECGTIYKVTPAGDLTYLYNFTCQPDGFNPWGSVVFDKSGNIYTTTTQGGTNNVGAVIKLTP